MTTPTLTRLGRPVPRTRFRGDTYLAPPAGRFAAWHRRVLHEIAAEGDPEVQRWAGGYHYARLAELAHQARHETAGGRREEEQRRCR